MAAALFYKQISFVLTWVSNLGTIRAVLPETGPVMHFLLSPAGYLVVTVSGFALLAGLVFFPDVQKLIGTTKNFSLEILAVTPLYQADGIPKVKIDLVVRNRGSSTMTIDRWQINIATKQIPEKDFFTLADPVLTKWDESWHGPNLFLLDDQPIEAGTRRAGWLCFTITDAFFEEMLKAAPCETTVSFYDVADNLYSASHSGIE